MGDNSINWDEIRIWDEKPMGFKRNPYRVDFSPWMLQWLKEDMVQWMHYS